MGSKGGRKLNPRKKKRESCRSHVLPSWPQSLGMAVDRKTQETICTKGSNYRDCAKVLHCAVSFRACGNVANQCSSHVHTVGWQTHCVRFCDACLCLRNLRLFVFTVWCVCQFGKARNVHRPSRIGSAFDKRAALDFISRFQ